MREDEVEALLTLDNAGLAVGRNNSGGWTAAIRLPKDLHTTKTNPKDHFMFTGDGNDRQEAIANVWRVYQEFASSERGSNALRNNEGQFMFRL